MQQPERKTRTIRWTGPAPTALLRRDRSGLDFFRAIAAGDLDQPPMYHAMGFAVVDAASGYSRFECDPGDFLCNPLGTVHGGLPATLIDSAAGVSVQSTLDRGQTTATIRLNVDFVRAITPGTGPLVCEGRLVRAGRRIAFADAAVTDLDGLLYARGSGSFMISEAPAGTAEAAGPDEAAPETHERTYDYVPPAYLAAAARERTPQDFLRGMADGSLPPPTIADTLDMGLAEIGDGTATFTVTPRGFHYNPMGSAHGGLPAALLDSATGCAVQSKLAPGFGFTTVSLSVDFLRPVTTAAGPLRCTATAVRVGARIGIAEGTLIDAAGTLYARGSSSCMLLAY